jgi:hypothetical protein
MWTFGGLDCPPVIGVEETFDLLVNESVHKPLAEIDI